MKSQVFKTAHQIKSLFSSWSNALKAAWRIVKMKLNIPTKIEFAKKNTGEFRSAIGIGCSLKTIKKGFVRFLERTDSGIEQWRSFRISNLIF